MSDLPVTEIVSGYRVTVERCKDDTDPARGEWVDCWVTSAGGGHSNSLALLEDLGQFDDGPKITNQALHAIRLFAERHGYE